MCVVMPIHLYRVRLTQCSCVDVSSLDLVIHGCTLYGSSSSRMSTRRLPVITLCFSFRVHILSCFVLLVVSMVAEEVFFSFAPSGVSSLDDVFQSLFLIILLPPPP